jgi:hypothetical protein
VRDDVNPGENEVAQVDLDLSILGRLRAAPLTWDIAQIAKRLHDRRMEELIAKANQAILESQWLRNMGRLLRFEAAVHASKLSATILQVRAETRKIAQGSSPADGSDT